MNKKNKKTLITYLLVISTIITASNHKRKKEIPNNVPIKASYSINYDNNVYIIDEEYYEILKPLLDNKDIVVIDERMTEDPNMRIKDSYKINNIWIIRKVLNILIQYENDNPTNWNRTIDSMEIEWLIHNLFSKLNIQNKRTNDVDLNNLDEAVFKCRILTRKK